ncbi:WbqC family protein [Pontibacter toksunensis]|uniref:WbqC family protein n=1 Tax=Pontibacter toksunensis TaxID=1332631 RepID=A0ABW6BWX0_9BACT
MKIAIMQPYVFPYIGYFQMLQAVDLFVLYDDVQYTKKGWINRNRILLNGSAHTFTIPCLNPSQNKLIKDISVDWSSKETRKLRATIETAYCKAPYFEEVYPLLEAVLQNKAQETIADLATESIKQVCSYLGLTTSIKRSSQANYANHELRREDRLVDIVLKENGNEYINAIGGRELYTKASFARHGIQLHFIQSMPISYPQPNGEFVPWLSMVDVLMFNDKDTIATYLKSYKLL